MKLENLQAHLNSCQYDPNYSGIVCDKGCNLMITRREYECNNCMQHLLNRVSSLEEKLNEKTKHSLTASVNAPTDNTALHAQMWRTNRNMFITMDESNYILKGHKADGNFWPTAQANYSLTSENSSFKVKMGLSGFVGLTRKEYGIESSDDSINARDGSIFAYFNSFYNKIDLYHNHETVTICKIPSGGVFECGITLPYDFDSNRDNNVEVYFSSNNVTHLRRVIKMPREGLYPTIILLQGASAHFLRN